MHTSIFFLWNWFNNDTYFKENNDTFRWHNTVDSRYLEVQGTLWNTSRYPYLDISGLQNRGKKKSYNYISQMNIHIIKLLKLNILKILWKRGEIAPLFNNIFQLLLGFHVKTETRFLLRDKRLFEISEVEITRVGCTFKSVCLSPEKWSAQGGKGLLPMACRNKQWIKKLYQCRKIFS